MNRNPFHAVLTFIVGVIAAAAILVLLTLPADASASAYTCRWTVNHYRIDQGGTSTRWIG